MSTITSRIRGWLAEGSDGKLIEKLPPNPPMFNPPLGTQFEPEHVCPIDYRRDRYLTIREGYGDGVYVEQ